MTVAQERTLKNHRTRLKERGLARYEVRGLERDKELVRNLAKRLAANDADAARLRRELGVQADGGPPSRGGFLKWIRSSPLGGVDLNIEREIVPLRYLDR